MNDEAQVLIRLNALMKAGYKIETVSSQEVQDAIWLKHPASTRAKEPSLILFSDGKVVAGNSSLNDKEQLYIQPDEISQFNNFVNSVPEATLWERSAEFRSSAIAWVFLGLVMYAGASLTNFVIGLFK
jgi:hypothetical protein